MSSLNDMPDDVLIRLLNTAGSRDVARAKRLNKRINQIVETYNLGKPNVKEFSIQSRVSSTLPTKIGRLRFGSQGSPKKSIVVTMKRERTMKCVENVEDPSCSTASNNFVQENMRKVILSEKLSLDGVTIDTAFFDMLTAKWNDLKHVTTVSLSLCHIRITWTQFAELLSRMTVKKLYLDFCTFDPSLISDKVLMSLPHLEVLQIQPRYSCFLNELTDQTLIHWASRPIPISVQLRNYCASRVSLEGIRALMMSRHIHPSPEDRSTIDWDFGLLVEATQTDSILVSLILCPGMNINVMDDFRSRRIRLYRDRFVAHFNLYSPFPTGPVSAPAPVNA